MFVCCVCQGNIGLENLFNLSIDDDPKVPPVSINNGSNYLSTNIIMAF